MSTPVTHRDDHATLPPVTPDQAALNRVTLLAEVLAYEGEHPAPEDPWTPEALARFGPDTEVPF
jgi:hypothetical protein